MSSWLLDGTEKAHAKGDVERFATEALCAKVNFVVVV